MLILSKDVDVPGLGEFLRIRLGHMFCLILGDMIKGKSWVPFIPPIYGLYTGCIGESGAIFWEQL